jgi:aminoglycoside phosphotransferase (APT) family kinase protein
MAGKAKSPPDTQLNLLATPAGRPPADIVLDESLALRLLQAQHPDLARLPLRRAAEGWDNVILRLGEDLALRLPRRRVAAALLRHEQAWLPVLAPRLPLAIPAPVRLGRPQGAYPWPWSVTPWLAGETADIAPPGADQGEVLADFFAALHRPAPDEAPINPFRGIPLVSRLATFEARRLSLARLDEPLDVRLEGLWQDALAAPDDAAPTWIHGDLHPRNVLTLGGQFSAVIDWGDLARGDRASDLAGVWMLLGARRARETAIERLTDVSAATWARARGWAVLYGVMLLDAGLADDAPMAPIARTILANLLAGP